VHQKKVLKEKQNLPFDQKKPITYYTIWPLETAENPKTEKMDAK